MDKPSDKPTDIGMNRSGSRMFPTRTKEMIEGVKTLMPPTAPDGVRLEALRTEISKNAPPVGLMPPPPTLKGMAKSAIEALKGKDPLVFLDQLGERLAFERTGVRLYQAVLAKWEASHGHEGGPTREELERLCDEELKHFAMVERAIESLGADPTVVTPCADASGVLATGAMQLLTDPRTTLTQALGGLLMIELTDNDSWRMLIALSEKLGQDEMAREFRNALVEEDEHLMLVRRWHANAIFGQAGVEAPIEMETRPSPHS